MRLVTVAVLAALLSGCGKPQPTTAGGKPVSYWVEALHDRDARLRKQAAFKLGNVGPADAAALPALIGALKDRDARVRCEAILALVKFGPDAKEAIP
ncbi:MAG TPA: HEAT repeat domain-containing protein, partial [Gemmataceae bacterium]|nr:HEAT repeat domain-containing protein [Gemmataceae bacterium]